MRSVQAIVDTFSDHVALLDQQGEIVAVNCAWRRYGKRNGGSSDGYLHRNYLEICQQAVAAGDETAQLPLEGIRDVLQKKRFSFQYEYPCHSPTEQSWFIVAAAPLDDGAIVTHSEVTRQRRRETSLEVSEHRLKEALNGLDVAFYLLDAGAKVLFFNRAAEVMAGHFRTAVQVGAPFTQLFPEAAALFAESFAHALGGTPISHELQIVDRWLELHYHPIFEHGRVSEVCLSLRDVGAQQSFEAALRDYRESESLYLERAPLGVVEWGVQRTITAWNRAAERMFGSSARDMMGAPLADVFGAASSHLEDAPLDAFFLLEMPATASATHNTYRWFCTPRNNTQGAAVGTVAFVQDVTEERSLLTAARVSEEQVARLFRRSLLPMLVVTSAEFYVKEANASFLSLSEYGLAEVVGYSLVDLGLLPGVSAAELQLLGAPATAPTEQHLQTRSGLWLTVLLQVEPLAAQEALLVSFLDLTKQWYTEAHLLRALQEVVQDSTWLGRAVIEKLAQYRSVKTAPPDTRSLTRRERQVLQLLAQGHTNKTIAETLNISHQTVRNYITQVYDKLELHSRAEAVVWARERGIGTG